MLKFVSILSVTLLGSYALACNQVTLRTPVEIAESLREKEISCNYNGVISEATLSVGYPRCPNSNPVVYLRAFEDSFLVNEISQEGNVVTIVSDNLDLPVTCEVK